MKIPPGRAHLASLFGRSRVRVFLGHLCTEWPQNPSVAWLVCADGKGSEKEVLWFIKGGAGGTHTRDGRSAPLLLLEPHLIKLGPITRHLPSGGYPLSAL